MIDERGKIMPVKVGCASDYNKNRPDNTQKKRNEETVVLVANKRYGRLIMTNIFQKGLRALSLTKNGKNFQL